MFLTYTIYRLRNKRYRQKCHYQVDERVTTRLFFAYIFAIFGKSLSEKYSIYYSHNFICFLERGNSLAVLLFFG